MFLYAALATAFLRGATASNVTTALCSWLGGACQANASECAAGAAFVSMKDICGGSGFGCCLGARATWAPTLAPAAGPPTAAPTNATSSSQKSCDKRFERGLRPLAKLYFNERCVVDLDLNKYNCPMNALNAILKEYIGGLRVEAFWLSFLSLVALICIIQLGGVPRATGEPLCSPSRFGTVVWAVYLIAFILQLLALLLSVVMMVFSYVLMRREFRPCMNSFGHGAKILDVAAFVAFVFIPPVLFRLAVILVTILGITETVMVFSATGRAFDLDELERLDLSPEDFAERKKEALRLEVNVRRFMVYPLFFVAFCFFYLYGASCSWVFSLIFFVPLGIGLGVLPVLSFAFLSFINRWSSGSETVLGQEFARMLWWVDPSFFIDNYFWAFIFACTGKDGEPEREKKIEERRKRRIDSSRVIDAVSNFLYLIICCPMIVFGIWAAAYVYSGNSYSDNMHAIATMYEYAFQIFWVGKFSLPNFALDFHRVEDAFTYLAGFSAIDSFTVQEYFAGAHAFDTLNFIISVLKAVVAFIAAFVAWYSDSFGLKPNVDFDVSFKTDDSIALRKTLLQEAEQSTEMDVVLKRLDGINERLERLQMEKEDVEAPSAPSSQQIPEPAGASASWAHRIYTPSIVRKFLPL